MTIVEPLFDRAIQLKALERSLNEGHPACTWRIFPEDRDIIRVTATMIMPNGEKLNATCTLPDYTDIERFMGELGFAMVNHLADGIYKWKPKRRQPCGMTFPNPCHQ